MFCPKCGKPIREGSRFCANCGYALKTAAPLSEKPEERKVETQSYVRPATSKTKKAVPHRKKKKKKAPIILILALLVLACAAAVLVLRLKSSVTGGKSSADSVFIYVNDGELYAGKEGKEGIRLTKNFSDYADGIFSETSLRSTILSLTTITEDGKYLYFPDDVLQGETYSLYRLALDKSKAEREFVASGVDWYAVSEDGEIVTYHTDGVDVMRSLEVSTGNVRTISDDFSDVDTVSSDGQKVLYWDNDSLTLWDRSGGRTELVSNNIGSQALYTNEDLSCILYRKGGEIRRYENGQDTCLVDLSDGEYVEQVNDDGTFYYTVDEDYEFKYADLVSNPDRIKSDTLRQIVENGSDVLSSHALYYFNGETSVKLFDGYEDEVCTDSEGGSFAFAGDNLVELIETVSFDASDLDGISDESDFLNYLEDYVIDQGWEEKLYMAIGDRVGEIPESYGGLSGENFKYMRTADDGTCYVFAQDYGEVADGCVYAVTIGDEGLANARKLAYDYVYPYVTCFTSSGVPVIFAGYDDYDDYGLIYVGEKIFADGAANLYTVTVDGENIYYVDPDGKLNVFNYEKDEDKLLATGANGYGGIVPLGKKVAYISGENVMVTNGKKAQIYDDGTAIIVPKAAGYRTAEE